MTDNMALKKEYSLGTRSPIADTLQGMAEGEVAYRICARCVMDTSDPEIEFDRDGICNHCCAAEARLRRELFAGDEHAESVERIIGEIKERGRGKPYDSVLGVSGGVDSSYVAYLAKRKFGLRPLAVHFDNGWNSELAIKNIENVLNKLDIDLYTYVMDWDEFRDLQVAFLKSSVSNCEIPTDHAITALLYRTAAERGIGYILSGSNLATETIMPRSWLHTNLDLRFLKSINRRFGANRLHKLPSISARDFLYYTFVKRIRFIAPLNYLEFGKEAAIAELEKELGWRRYGGKHFESIYTRFFQGYILPRKFGMDKRRPHFSSLIVSGQMTRDEALGELQRNDYVTENAEEDREYVTKKLGLTEEEFDDIMRAIPKKSTDYPSNLWLFTNLAPFIQTVKKVATKR